MRILVACGECERRYDASRHPVGSRFRCRCGTVLTVSTPRSHDARVVRCSSCGGGRQDGSMTCTFCGDDFSLHERDLHTVCPKCMTRVSDRAKFCHHCATPLFASEAVGEQTSRSCPACDDSARLHSRRLGETRISALECDRCAGFWLGNEAFEQLARSAEGSGPVSVVQRKVTRRQSHVPTRRRSRYRQCPFCNALMNRFNYGMRRTGAGSGTIIDVCRDHGIWFDADELAQILLWLRDEGQAVPLGAPRQTPSPGVTERPRSPEPVSSIEKVDDVEWIDEPDDSLPRAARQLGMLLSSFFDV